MGDIYLSREERQIRRKYIAESIKNGISIEAICDRLKVHPSTVRAACKEYGVKPASKYHIEKTTTNTYQILARLINTDDSLAEVARQYSLTRQAVHLIYHKAIRAGIVMPSREVEAKDALNVAAEKLRKLSNRGSVPPQQGSNQTPGREPAKKDGK